jgi:TonB family protein
VILDEPLFAMPPRERFVELASFIINNLGLRASADEIVFPVHWQVSKPLPSGVYLVKGQHFQIPKERVMRYLAVVLVALSFLTLPVLASPGNSVSGSQGDVAFDKAPEPVGGWTALTQLVNYPESARKQAIQGTVFLSIVIGTDGNVGKIEVTEGIREDLNRAATEALKKSKWLPAEKDGKPVEAQFTIPVAFKLDMKSKN